MTILDKIVKAIGDGEYTKPVSERGQSKVNLEAKYKNLCNVLNEKNAEIKRLTAEVKALKHFRARVTLELCGGDGCPGCLGCRSIPEIDGPQERAAVKTSEQTP